MDEKTKNYLLGVIPDKVRILRTRHRECAEKYRSYWDTMPDRFAAMLDKDPEKTLEDFLSLRDEVCAWDEADFMTRDLYLDNFIARELARELKKELEGMTVGVEAGPLGEHLEASPEAVHALLKENIKLKKQADELEQELGECAKEKERLMAELQKPRKAAPKKTSEKRRELETMVARAESKLKLLKKDYARLEAYSKGLEKKLQKCIQRRDTRKLMRLAGILRIGVEKGGFTPSYAAKRLGINIDTVYDYLKELREVGMLKRIDHGYYELAEKVKDEGLEEEIALRLVQKDKKKGKAQTVKDEGQGGGE